MPGLWVHLKDNPDFFQDFTLQKGEYLESSLYDEGHHDQGKGLWRVGSPEAKSKHGLWTSAKLVAVSDEHLFWWLTEGGGKDAGRKFWLHLCTSEHAGCTKTKRKPQEEFHTDYFRILDSADVANHRVQWFKANPAKDDLADEVARLTGVAPQGGKKKKQTHTGRGGRGDLDWSLSDQESLPDLGGDDDEGVKQRLAALKRQTAGEPPWKEGEGDARHKQKKRERSRSRKRRRGRDQKRSRTPEKEKQRPLWFGKKVSVSSCGEDSSDSLRGPTYRGDKKKKKRSRSVSDDKPKKKARRDKQADRGPYGVGQRVRYDGKSSDGVPSDEESAQHDESVFRAGPSTTSKHLQLQEYAEKRPGRLTARLLKKMKDILAREEGPMNQGNVANLTPSAATSYTS